MQAVAPASSGSSSARVVSQPPPSSAVDPAAASQRVVRPPVPLFAEPQAAGQPPPQRLDPCVALRQTELGEKRWEDNYEISEQGGDSDAEESQAKDRSGKHVPKWCESYLAELQRQCDIDPDTIFGNKVPQCNLEDIFNNDMYRQAGKNRPKRTRGSSGDWRKDRLTRTEVRDYKSRMGHTRCWQKENAEDLH